MSGLVKNELMKIFAKKSSWIMAIILIIVSIAGAIIELNVTEQAKDKSVDWKVEAKQEIAELEKKLETAPSEESYFESGGNNFDETKEGIQYQIERLTTNIENDVSPYTTSWSFMGTMIISLKSMITLFVVTVCAANVSSEYSDGTIKQLLIRPHRRWKVLLSKYIALLIYAAGLIVTLIVGGYLVSIAFFGIGDFNANIYPSYGMEASVHAGPYFFQMLLYYLPGFLLILTLAFMLSTLFKNQSIAVGVGVFTLFVSSTLGGLIMLLVEQGYTWTKFLIFPHLDQTYFVLNDKILETITMPVSLGILAVHYIIFLIITFWFFNKKDISI